MWTKEDRLAFLEEYEAICRKYRLIILSWEEESCIFSAAIEEIEAQILYLRDKI